MFLKYNPVLVHRLSRSFPDLQVGKVALLEVVLLADALGYSVVATALALASLEAAIEFGASAIVPPLYRLAFGTWALSARGLMHFAVGAYTVSAGVACVFYPVLGLVTQRAGVQTEATLLVFAVCHAFQYPFLNQLGDQVREPDPRKKRQRMIGQWGHVNRDFAITISEACGSLR